jgi:hypothetical protein
MIGLAAIRRTARVGDPIVLRVQEDALGRTVKIIVLAAP